jgi:aspartyl-tRNA(Asn)/glutamyl-tRNA(Gln) amidotransferase subunit C
MPQVNLQIDRIARLARIKITPEEAIRLSSDLNEITGYFEQIRLIDTNSALASSFAPQLSPGRLDRPIESLVQAEAIGNAPRTDGRFFLVPKVIDK